MTPNEVGGNLPEIIAAAPLRSLSSPETGEPCFGSNTLCQDATNSLALHVSRWTSWRLGEDEMCIWCRWGPHPRTKQRQVQLLR